MGGFLKKLQKNQANEAASPDHVVVRSSEFPIDTATRLSLQANEPQQPAEGGQDAGSTSEANRFQKSEKVVLKRQTLIEEKPKSPVRATPWWLAEPKKANPQLDALIARAVKKLRIRIKVAYSEAEVFETVREELNRSVDELKEEFRFTRKIVDEAEAELFGLLKGKGMLRPLYEDSAVTDIFIDSYRSIKVLRDGRALETPFSFRTVEEYDLYLSVLLLLGGADPDSSDPVLDCVLNDEFRSRLNVIGSSLTENGERRTAIRIPRVKKTTFYDLLHEKTLPPTLAAWLAEVWGQGEANLLVAGPRGSGKTTMITALLASTASDERIVMVEQVPELFAATAQLEKLCAGPESAGNEVRPAELVRIALRRGCRRIVLGDILGEESQAFLGALEAGYRGSIASINADNSVDCLWRFLDCVAAFEKSAEESIMRRIARSVHLVLFMKRTEGTPCLLEVAEVKRIEKGEFVLQPLVRYSGVSNGKRQWQIETNHSYWLSCLAERGVKLAPGPGLKSFQAPANKSEAVP